MLSFYGRRLVKGTKESDLHSLFKSPFFLTEKDFDEFWYVFCDIFSLNFGLNSGTQNQWKIDAKSIKNRLWSWDPFLAILGPFWDPFGGSFFDFSASWALLGPSWAPGGVSGPFFFDSLTIFGDFWVPPGPLLQPLGRSWSTFGIPYGTLREFVRETSDSGDQREVQWIDRQMDE